MIDFETAEQIAIKHINADCVLVEEATLEKPYGWYFYGQTKTFFKTKDFRDALVGSGGFLVERDGGRIVEFGSAYPLETWIKNYEKGFKYQWYDLTILRVFDQKTTAKMLVDLGMWYAIPEWEHGVERRISKQYTVTEIENLLLKLPCTFMHQAFWHRVKIFDNIDEVKCCEYVLTESIAA